MDDHGAVPWQSLDESQVGRAMMHAVLGALPAGGNRASEVPAACLTHNDEGRFVYEALTRPAAEIADRWFWGEQLSRRAYVETIAREADRLFCELNDLEEHLEQLSDHQPDRVDTPEPQDCPA
ncbi:hypothetical protein OHR68_20120 [Spirillospora sp. NBC_00431]